MRVDQLRMLGDNLLAKLITDDKTAGGLIIPDVAKPRRPDRARVVLVGPGETLAEMAIEPGNLIIVEDFVGSGTPIDIDGERHHIFGADEIMAVIG
jgi:chaperonin GroES